MSLCGVIASAALADDQSDVRAAYTKFGNAMKARDAKAVLSLATPDFKEVRVNGKTVQGKEAEQQLKDQLASTTRVDDATIKLDSITVTQNRAVVWTSYSYRAEVVDKDGKMGPKGAKHIYADSGKTRDILVKSPKGWVFSERKTLKWNPTMDGQSTFHMGARGGRR
jgi:ketosteroid isomerase-like protein